MSKTLQKFTILYFHHKDVIDVHTSYLYAYSIDEAKDLIKRWYTKFPYPVHTIKSHDIVRGTVKVVVERDDNDTITGYHVEKCLDKIKHSQVEKENYYHRIINKLEEKENAEQ